MALEPDRERLALQALRRVIITMEQRTAQTAEWSHAVQQLRDAFVDFEAELYFSNCDDN